VCTIDDIYGELVQEQIFEDFEQQIQSDLTDIAINKIRAFPFRPGKAVIYGPI